jgi:hypothetical protein
VSLLQTWTFVFACLYYKPGLFYTQKIQKSVYGTENKENKKSRFVIEARISKNMKSQEECKSGFFLKSKKKPKKFFIKKMKSIPYTKVHFIVTMV